MRPTRVHSIGGLPVLDVALATVLTIASVGSQVTGDVDEGPLAITMPVAVISSLSLLARTRAPIAAAVAVSIASLVQSIWGSTPPGTLMSLVIVLVLAYSIAAEHEEAVAATGLAVLLAGSFIDEWLHSGSDYAFIAIELGGAWLLGRGARVLRSRATYAEQHQDDLARLAVADERARIARELHDVVAHGLSVIAVQADAAEAALAKEPDRAAEPLRAIRSSAREALDDMRQLLRVLRTDSPDDDRSPARGLADLDALVTGLRETGLPVEVDIRVVDGVPPGVELAVFRIAQEGLTNVIKHAGAVPTRLTIEPASDGLRVTVRNAPSARTTPAEPGGHGLRGARERTHAAGGSLRSGPTDDGGFEVVATLPLHQDVR